MKIITIFKIMKTEMINSFYYYLLSTKQSLTQIQVNFRNKIGKYYSKRLKYSKPLFILGGIRRHLIARDTL